MGFARERPRVCRGQVGLARKLQALLHSVQTKLAGVAPFLLCRLTLSRDKLVKRIQTRLDTAIATKTSRQAMHNAVAAERAAKKRTSSRSALRFVPT
jgi:hypothetical protein